MSNPDIPAGQRRLAVVTGASEGIGFELAKVFALNSYDLLIVADDLGIADAARKLGEIGVRVDFANIDLSKLGGTEELYSRILQSERPVEILALNAGIGAYGEFEHTRIDQELNVIDLNISSTVHLAKLLVRDMRRAGGGRILITSSIEGETPGPFNAVFAASQAFLKSFSEALHYELKDKNIVVTLLEPGPTATRFFERAGMCDTKMARGEREHPADVARAGFDALMAGKDHVVVTGSFRNKMMATAGKLLSEQMGAKMHARDISPYTRQ